MELSDVGRETGKNIDLQLQIGALYMVVSSTQMNQ